MQNTQQVNGPKADNEVQDENMWAALGRAFAGALLFSISLLMTLETWQLGSYLNRWQFVLFIVVNMLLLVGLAYYRGFHEKLSWREAIIDAFVGYAIGVITGAIFLSLFGVIKWDMSADEIVGKIALQAITGGIGALLARTQLSSTRAQTEEKPVLAQGYWAEIFLMVAGALFISYAVAPTEEVILIAYQMTPWHALVAVVLSLVILHVFVYGVEFRGQEAIPEGKSSWLVFLHFTVIGYVAVFLASLYILWSFGRTTGVAFPMIVMYSIVLSVPGALGAAVARLIL